MSGAFREYIDGEGIVPLPAFLSLTPTRDGGFTDHSLHLFGVYHRLASCGAEVLYGAGISVPDAVFLQERAIRVQVFPDATLDAKLGASRTQTTVLRTGGERYLTRARQRPRAQARAALEKYLDAITDSMERYPDKQRHAVLSNLGVLSLTDRLWIHGLSGKQGKRTFCIFNGTVEELLDRYAISQQAELEDFFEVAQELMRDRYAPTGPDKTDKPVGMRFGDSVVPFVPMEDEDDE